MKPLRRFILALQFLTLFSVKKNITVEPEELSRSMAFFPVVGALQGVVVAGADYLLRDMLPAGPESALLLVILFLTNGGLHLDGFMDTVDGLAGGSTPERRLEIMRTSSVGAIGVVAVVLLILLKYQCVVSLTADIRSRALFLFPVAGRWAIVPMACWARYARSGAGLGRAFSGNSTGTFVIAAVFAAAMAAYLMGAAGLAAMALIVPAAYISTVFFRAKVGGTTGDIMGFQSEIGEVLFLVFIFLVYGRL